MVLCALAFTTSAYAEAALNALTEKEKQDGWQLLFDGRSLNGWHGLGFKDVPPGIWVIEDGAIKHLQNGKGPVQRDGQPLTGMDLVSDGAWRDFELAWEWKIAPAGNSGVKYNVSEEHSASMDPPHAAKGWEYQVLDDEKAEDNKVPTHRAGALYDMFVPDEQRKRLRPVGEWNQSRIVLRGTHGEHWLNGERVVSFELAGAAYDSAFARSKYHSYPAWFAERRVGRIVLQDHGDAVWFRSIRIREIR
jgi:hypothetical protein